MNDDRTLVKGIVSRIDNGFVNFLQAGKDALPHDLSLLSDYMSLISEMMLENANAVETSWEMVEQTASEIELLHVMESIIVDRVSETPAETMKDILLKFDIFSAFSHSSEDDDCCLKDRLANSIRDDLQRVGHPCPLQRRFKASDIAATPRHCQKAPA